MEVRRELRAPDSDMELAACEESWFLQVRLRGALFASS